MSSKRDRILKVIAPETESGREEKETHTHSG
jgi:hypothetical protein